MLYDIGCVDVSGRVSTRGIISALRWEAGSKLEMILTDRAIIIRASSEGLFTQPRKSCVFIPAQARRQHDITPGDHVLVAAAPDYGLAIVYPLSALDEMICRYHAEEPAAEDHQQ